MLLGLLVDPYQPHALHAFDRIDVAKRNSVHGRPPRSTRILDQCSSAARTGKSCCSVSDLSFLQVSLQVVTVDEIPANSKK